MDFLCTLVFARRALSLPSYTLPFVLDALHLPLGTHHDPLDDSRAVAAIIGALATERHALDARDLANSLNVRVGRMAAGSHIGSSAATSRAAGGSGRLVPVPAEANADRDGPLFGKTVVFAGTLMSMTRQAAWDACAAVEARAENDTTKRTNVLVVGGISPERLRPGATLTGKAAKAALLQKAGQDIEIMTEDDFLRCIADASMPLAPSHSRSVSQHSTDASPMSRVFPGRPLL